MKNNSILELIEKFNEVKKMGWIETKRSGPTGIGYTFETIIGKKENSLPYFDFNDIEIKVHKKRTSFPIHLFNATPDGDELFPIKSIINKLGYPDKIEPKYKVFNVTISGNKYTNLGYYKRLKLKIDYTNQKICLIAINNSNENLGLNISWSFDLLKDKIKYKINRIAIIEADSKLLNGKEYYKYENIHFYQIKGFDDLIKMIENGIIDITFKIGVFRSGIRKGQVHDRGTDFSIKQADLDKIYDLIPSEHYNKVYNVI